MIILSRGSLTQTGRFAPETMALNLSERQSTATITMKIGAAELAVGDWLQDDTEPGEGIVWRVKTIDKQYNTDTQTVQLEHMINSLADQLLNGEITPATIAGGSATNCTAYQAITYILNRQSVWTLDDFDYSSVSNPYNFNGDSLKAAIETVSSSLTDPIWSYDFSTYPFKLSITQQASSVASEMRMSRNISTMKVSVDRSRMYTRFYPIGKNNLRLAAPGYVSRNESTWGVIEKTETDQGKDTVAKLTSWANERLNVHAQPMITVTISGLDLSETTGVDLDHLEIGRKCQVPLPEYATTVTEMITKLSWRDKLREPENVTVTMANQQEDIASIINSITKASGSGGRKAAKDQEEDHAWFVDTTDHVSMVAEAVAGKDGEGNPNWSRVSELTVDGNGIDARVTQTESDMVEAFSAIAMTATNILVEVGNAKSDLYSYIDVTAEGIEIATAAANSSMYSVIQTTATNIHTEVSRRARVFVQVTDPRNNAGVSLITGDIWIKSVRVQSWNDFAGKTWSDAGSFDWNQYAGAPQYTWDGTRWEKIGDYGATVEWGTRIDQNEKNITLIAHAIGAIDPTALAEIDISADAITLAVSSAKSELYSVIRQTSTNITAEVGNEIDGISSYVEQTASTLNSAIARKNKVYTMQSDPQYSYTVIDGDIWIKTSGNDNVHPTWNELSAKSWASQNSTNWREYYEGYWYVRKNGSWERMNANADVVEIGTKVERDEKQISLIARDVDANHQELGARLQVTATQIRSEVHAAKSTLYSVIEQTATQIRSEVTNTTAGLTSSITQNANKIALVVETRGGTDYIKPASIVAAINDGASTIKLSADHIDIDGLVTALGAKDIGCGRLTVEGYSEFYKAVEIGEGIIFDAGAGIRIGDGNIKMGNYNVSWKSKTVMTGVTRSNTRNFVYARNGNISDLDTILGSLVTDTATATIYYLGR